MLQNICTVARFRDSGELEAVPDSPAGPAEVVSSSAPRTLPRAGGPDYGS